MNFKIKSLKHYGGNISKIYPVPAIVDSCNENNHCLCSITIETLEDLMSIISAIDKKVIISDVYYDNNANKVNQPTITIYDDWAE